MVGHTRNIFNPSSIVRSRKLFGKEPLKPEILCLKSAVDMRLKIKYSSLQNDKSFSGCHREKFVLGCIDGYNTFFFKVCYGIVWDLYATCEEQLL